MYAAYVEAESKAERERRATIDTRGLAVVTSSATFTTIALALSSVLPSFGRPGSSGLGLFTVAVALLVVACCMGVLSTLNLSYEVGSTETAQRMLTDRWTDDEVDARNLVATLHLATTRRLRQGNGRKSRLLLLALSAQALGVVLLGVAVQAVLR